MTVCTCVGCSKSLEDGDPLPSLLCPNLGFSSACAQLLSLLSRAVAFYWFLMAALVCFIFPMSKSFWNVLPRVGKDNNWTRGVGSCKAKLAKVDAAARKEMLGKVFGWRGVGFLVGWVMLISLALKLTSMSGEEMFTFNPYKILGVEEGAEMSEVKKAYRKLSLKNHVRSRPPQNTQQQ